MRRTLLAILLCLVSSSADATVRTVGTGKDYTVMATAFAALVSGDTIESYGPYTENNQTLAPPAGITGIIWRHYGADYTFDGTGATSVWLTLAATNTGWDINARSSFGIVKTMGYIGAQPFVITGASNTVGGIRMTANGAVGVYQLTVVSSGNSNVLQDITIDNPVDAPGMSWFGIYLSGGSGQQVLGCTVENITGTGAATRYMMGTASGASSPIFSKATIRNISVGGAMYGVYGSGANGYITILDSKVYGVTAGGIIRCFQMINRSGIMQNLLAYNFVSPSVDRGIVFDGTQVSAGNPNSFVNNCTIIGGEYGIEMAAAPIGGTRTALNNVTSNCITNGFFTVAGGVSTSAGNIAGTAGYSALWPVSASDLSTNPVFVDAAASDYRLRWQPGVESPCVDSGQPIPTRVSDLSGQPMSGPAFDRGCFEFQQVGAHDARTPLTAGVLTPTRNFRGAR